MKQKDVTILAVGGNSSAEEIQAFVSEVGLNPNQVLLDLQSVLFGRLGITATPTWVLINDDGNVSAQAGALGNIEAKISELKSQ